MKVALSGGAYEARGLIGDAQRCLNLFPEQLPTSSQMPEQFFPPVWCYLPTPGLRTLLTLPDATTVRGLYRANTGDLYAVCGPSVYYVSPSWAATKLGSIAAGTTPVSMADNGTTLVLVDGTTSGYTIDLATHVMTAISQDGFYGADRVDYLDTFFVLNKPGTPQWYSTTSGTTTFDPLYFANKVGYADNLVSIAVSQRNIWLIGAATTEIWFDAGGATFPFQIVSGPFIEHGCAAVYSVAKQGGATFWLSQDLQGHAIAVMGADYKAERISTHAIEYAWSQYPTIADAVGYTYQQGGHAFYVLSFPTADKTWVYDSVAKLWHERAWIDDNGAEHRHRSNCGAFIYDINVVGDWQNGKLYALDQAVFTDAGQPIKRVRSFPHLVNDGKRVFYQRFQADMQVGTSLGTSSPAAAQLALGNDGNGLGFVYPGTQAGDPPPQVSLRWSDTRGATWGNPVMQSMGATGDFLCSIQWRRLGMARDRVYSVEWSAPVPTALLGAWIDLASGAS